MGTRAAAILAVVMVSGCGGYGFEAFPCGPGHACTGAGALCESTGFCSVADNACGRRYTDHSGDLSGTCVGQPIDAGISDTTTPPPDAPPDARLYCYGTAPISICFAAPPTGALPLSGTLDTMSSSMCASPVSGGNGYCVLAGATITIDARLRASGAKPLVLIATDSITTGAAIDVGSHRNLTPEAGAGADPSVCTTTTGTAPTNGGGGAGGSFTGLGGTGAASANAPSTGGMPGATATSIVLRGGCPGQDGEGANKGAGGHGGGAVLLIAGNTISLGSDIIAGGEGGAAGQQSTSGGGGGGAGGMIWLDAPAITNTGNNLILANGGAGGEGSGMNAGANGSPGDDATTIAAAVGGHGGIANGGDGGDGSATAAAGSGAPGLGGTITNPGNLHGGGGAGGGGAGIIKTRAGVNLGNKVSPAITTQ